MFFLVYPLPFPGGFVFFRDIHLSFNCLRIVVIYHHFSSLFLPVLLSLLLYLVLLSFRADGGGDLQSIKVSR